MTALGEGMKLCTAEQVLFFVKAVLNVKVSCRDKDIKEKFNTCGTPSRNSESFLREIRILELIFTYSLT